MEFELIDRETGEVMETFSEEDARGYLEEKGGWDVERLIKVMIENEWVVQVSPFSKMRMKKGE